MANIIQFKRGPSSRLSTVNKYPGEPIYLTDTKELLICREDGDPLVFRPYKKYLEAEKLTKQEEKELINNEPGKIWLDYNNELKFYTTYNGTPRTVTFGECLSRDDIESIREEISRETAEASLELIIALS